MHSACIRSPSDIAILFYSQCGVIIFIIIRRRIYDSESGKLPGKRIFFSESSHPSIKRFGSPTCQRIGQTYSVHQQNWAVLFSNLLLSCSENSWCCTKRNCHRSLCPSQMSSAQFSLLCGILRFNSTVSSEIVLNKKTSRLLANFERQACLIKVSMETSCMSNEQQ